MAGPIDLKFSGDILGNRGPPAMNICMIPFKGARGVEHGVWTHLHSFMIIRESIDITNAKTMHFLNCIGNVCWAR